MISLRFHEFGDPVSVLQVEDIASLEPGFDQVLVRVRARSINPADLLIVRGMYGVLPSLPATPGLEGMGEIVAVGDQVRDFLPGQRVSLYNLRGTWQEQVLATADQLIALPDTIADQSAAQFAVNPMSAWIMIEELALKRGEWLVQTAAASTLGRIVLQLARMAGFRTINIVRRPEQTDELKALGADEVISTDDTDLVARIREIAGDAGITKAIDAVGGETGAAVLRALAPGGTMLVYGALSMKPTPMDGSRLIYSTSSVRGFWLTRWRQDTPMEKQRSVIAKVLAAMASGDLVPPVEAEYALADFADAIRHVKHPARRGKVLLVG